MSMSDSRIWKTTFAIALMVCLSGGCSFARSGMPDRTMSMERVSVDDLLNESSDSSSPSHENDPSGQQSGGQTKPNGRQKLASWRDQRDGTSQSIPLSRTDRADSATTDEKFETASATPRSSSALSSSPFDQALTNGRKTKPRTASTDSASKSADSSGLGVDEKSLFEE